MAKGRIIADWTRANWQPCLGAAALMLALTTCRNQEQDASGQRGGGTFSAAPAAAAPAGNDVLCAAGGETRLQPGCTLDRSEGPDGPLLTIRNANGGFRRFLVVSDGRGIVPADGSEGANIKITAPGMIDLRVGGDVYRLPATFRSGASGQP